jgi:hypothetical protein
MKAFLFTILFAVSNMAFAQECASTISGLRNLVGNPAASLNWVQNTRKDPLRLNLSQGRGAILLNLSNSKGLWADVTGVVCKTGAESYVARVSNLSWGPAAPALVKMARIREIQLSLPYQTLLQVSVSGFSFEFRPL